MKPRNKRLLFAAVILAGLGAATLLVMNAFESNLVFFYTPTQVQAGQTPGTRVFRVGGLVEAGSVKRDGIAVQFKVTDTVHSMLVNFEGPLPDLFKEGKGVVAQGRMVDGVFKAQEVLAKHDENYMPPEAAEALKRAQSGGSMPAPNSGGKP